MYQDDLLKTQYSEKFDEIRKKMMVTSYYKFGDVRQNYKIVAGLRAIPSLKAKLKEYEETGNTEFLADVANFAMIEFMFPQKEGAYYKPTDGTNLKNRTTVGISVNEIRYIREGNEDYWLKYQN